MTGRPVPFLCTHTVALTALQGDLTRHEEGGAGVWRQAGMDFPSLLDSVLHLQIPRAFPPRPQGGDTECQAGASSVAVGGKGQRIAL